MADAEQDLQRILSEQDWDSLTPRLLAFAVHEIKRYQWRGTTGSWGDAKRCVLPGGTGPHDLVQQAVAKVLSGERRWDPVRHPDLLYYLIGIIKSDISTIAYGLLNQLDRREVVSEDENGNSHSTFDVVPDTSPNAREQWELENSEFVTAFYDHLKDEPDLQKIVDFVLEGDTKPSEFAARLSISIEKVNNLQKKLRRRRDDFIKKRAEKLNSVNSGGRP